MASKRGEDAQPGEQRPAASPQARAAWVRTALRVRVIHLASRAGASCPQSHARRVQGSEASFWGLLEALRGGSGLGVRVTVVPHLGGCQRLLGHGRSPGRRERGRSQGHCQGSQRVGKSLGILEGPRGGETPSTLPLPTAQFTYYLSCCALLVSYLRTVASSEISRGYTCFFSESLTVSAGLC